MSKKPAAKGPLLEFVHRPNSQDENRMAVFITLP
jgi:hypothetical protein